MGRKYKYFINLNQKYGRWYVLRKDKYHNNVQYYWCRCDCGTEKVVSNRGLFTGLSKSCGCLRREILKELDLKHLIPRIGPPIKHVIQLNKKYNRWTAIEQINKSNPRIYLCECECGNRKNIEAKDLSRGKSKSCGCLRVDSAKANFGHTKNGLPAGLNSAILGYTRGAKRRNLIWDLSYEDCIKFFAGNCYYCNKSPTQLIHPNTRSVFQYNGMDRTNNEIGYTISNVVSCCKICNYAKNTMSKEEFFTWIKSIIQQHKEILND